MPQLAPKPEILGDADFVGKGERYILTRRIELLQIAHDRARLDLDVQRQRVAAQAGPPRTHLVIGDSHADLGREPNDRYTWLGRLIADLKPNVVVDIGDWADMPSLCRYEPKGGTFMEGRRIADDEHSALDARARVQREVPRKLRDTIKWISTLGNHEQRIVRAANSDAALVGKLHIKNLGAEDHGWEVWPYLTPVLADGIWYAHAAVSPGTGREMGGIHHAANLVREYHGSRVVGHSHLRDYKEARYTSGQKFMSYVCGCYFEVDPDYAPATDRARWWRGLTLIRDVVDGYGYLEEWPIERVKARYG